MLRPTNIIKSSLGPVTPSVVIARRLNTDRQRRHSLRRQRQRRDQSGAALIFANVADPVGSGFVASVPRPGGSVTGFAKALGLTIPEAFLLRADELIEWSGSFAAIISRPVWHDSEVAENPDDFRFQGHTGRGRKGPPCRILTPSGPQGCWHGAAKTARS